MKNKITLVITPVILLIIYISTTSLSTGITGVSVSGCSCHCPSAQPTTIVTIGGLPAGGYTNGAVYPITLTVTNTTIIPGSFGLRDGFDMTASSGAFTAVAGTSLNGATEIKHSTPKAAPGGTTSWTFNWTAPAAGSSNITFNVAAIATNGDGANGGGNCTDKWNITSATVFKSGTALAVTASATAITCNGGGINPNCIGYWSNTPVYLQTECGYLSKWQHLYVFNCRYLYHHCKGCEFLNRFNHPNY